MNETNQALSVSLGPAGPVVWGTTRRSEPTTIGLPLPRGVAFAQDEIGLEDEKGRPKAVQVRPLDLWPDGSIRWALVDCLIDAEAGRPEHCVLRVGAVPQPSREARLQVTSAPGRVRISTGRAIFGFAVGGSFPFSEVLVSDQPSIDVNESGLQIERGGVLSRFRIADVRLDEAGPLRAAIELRATSDHGNPAPSLEVHARIEVFCASATVKVALTLRNTSRAGHSGGQWPLGDKGSLFLDRAALVLNVCGDIVGLRCAPERGDGIRKAQLPFEIHQESSGGDQWNNPVHKNRNGEVPLGYRGYHLRDGENKREGARATPIVVVDTSQGPLTFAIPRFWENFPRAIAVQGNRVEIGLFPGTARDVHELQGGEQKTHVVVLSFAEDPVSDPPLAWVHDPVLIYPSPEWCCSTGAVPLLVPAGREPNSLLGDFAEKAVAPPSGFFTKREAADEYGWRHFGDLPADHESAFQPADRPFVSHYNNQYDAIACFAIQFLRSGDRRWWELMVDLARHVRDIDIYHTDEDKAAYNGGLFWHTLHYHDAGTSSHRTYPRGGPASGGPAAEHNYNLGLMLHYFMTGEPASRFDAVRLGEWVIAMDDGRRTVFRWLAAGATGLASGSGSVTYHGPGRGAGNSILACLVAYRLTGDGAFKSKLEELIRRCIHPADDIGARQLLDAERRWFYTVFLQALGAYLQDKHERRDFDDMFFYARESLLHYARWMASHERPYLDHPELLEYPTETWAAQDLRKADVFSWAALFTSAEERGVFLARARFFRDNSFKTLAALPSHTLTRPTVLLLGNSVRLAWLDNSARLSLEQPAQAAMPKLPPAPVFFEPQRARALRRARWLAIGLGLMAFIAGAVLLVSAIR